MSILRVYKDKNYFVASNIPFNDERLSWEARGVIGYLLSKPDDWTIKVTNLINQTKAGQHVIRRVLKELERCGYLHRQRVRGAGGKFEWESVVYEKPTIVQKSVDGDATIGQFSIDGKPHDLISTDSNNYLFNNGEEKDEIQATANALDLPNGNGGSDGGVIEGSSTAEVLEQGVAGRVAVAEGGGEKAGVGLALSTGDLRQRFSEILRAAGVDDLEVEMRLVREVVGDRKAPARTAGDYKRSLAAAMARGENQVETLKIALDKEFRKNYLWSNKWARDTFLPWLREHVRKGDEIKRFADWWREEDWRGKSGQTPTLGQIYENWPQAFPAERPVEDVKFYINSSREAVSSSAFMGGMYFTPLRKVERAEGCPVVGYTRDNEPVYQVSDTTIAISGTEYRVQQGVY